MDQHDILYNCGGLTGLLFSACSLRARARTFLLSCSPLRWHSDRSLSLFIRLSVRLFSLSALCLSPSPRISQALWLFGCSPPHTLILHLSSSLSGVSVSARQGRPWSDLGGNELLITSQETRHSTPSPHPVQHTHTHTQKEGKKKVCTAIACSAHKEK